MPYMSLSCIGRSWSTLKSVPYRIEPAWVLNSAQRLRPCVRTGIRHHYEPLSNRVRRRAVHHVRGDLSLPRA